MNMGSIPFKAITDHKQWIWSFTSSRPLTKFPGPDWRRREPLLFPLSADHTGDLQSFPFSQLNRYLAASISSPCGKDRWEVA